MSTIVEIEKLALDLSEKERATLAASLLDSLPSTLLDEDEGIAEALRRDAEIEADPAQAISFAELDSLIQGRHGLKRLEFHRQIGSESLGSWITMKMLGATAC